MKRILEKNSLDSGIMHRILNCGIAQIQIQMKHKKKKTLQWCIYISFTFIIVWSASFREVGIRREKMEAERKLEEEE